MGEPFYGLNKVFEECVQTIGQLEWKSHWKQNFVCFSKTLPYSIWNPNNQNYRRMSKYS
jgi:hypothetical protein